ncbi:MAG: hypothetical protein V4640_12405 [Verrucomicrobiota bacterium]
MKAIHSAVVATCLLVSCGKKETAATAVREAAAPSSALQSVLAAAPVGDAQEIHVIRQTAKPGDEITISGKIMGNAKPFVDGRAAFTLADPSIITPCNENPDDACETPWDACCDTKEEKLIGLASVQVLGDDGRVLKEGLEGVGKLSNLTRVTVTGKVADGSSADSLVVNATAIRVNP